MEQEYAKYVANNQDLYGAGVIKFGATWADLMEKEIANGKSVAECAKQTSRQADTDGITGFMYGCAVSALSHFWTHGEELRRWHNIDTQIGTEGERANEKGTVLNPALLAIETKD